MLNTKKQRPSILLNHFGKVFSNIRLLKKTSLYFALLFPVFAYSQVEATVDEIDKPNQQQNTNTQEIEQSTQASPQSILRLEDTIRGNKEQPQVLTIVPWQLPVHQRISDNQQWGLQVNPLPSIERTAFLRRLAVVKEINAVASSDALSTKESLTSAVSQSASSEQ
jgi:hypothetical protein